MYDPRPVPYRLYSPGGVSEERAPLPRESMLSIRLNGWDLVTLMCTPSLIDRMVVGFLFSEGVIRSADEIVLLGLCPDDGTAEVWLEDERRAPPGTRVLTSGCGKGATFITEVSLPRVESVSPVSPQRVYRLMRTMLAAAQDYRASGGTHSAALGQGGDLVAAAEDVGRHNAVDKVIGECLVSDLPLAGGVLLTTGRVSSEMISKAARAQVPVVASLTSPTDRAVALADGLGITLIGYVRGLTMRVYAHAWRVEG